LLTRVTMFVARQQGDGVLIADGVIIGLEPQRLLEKMLGVVHGIELHADLREQPHTLDVIAVVPQVLAHDLLRRLNCAVREHAEGGEDLRRQLREPRRLSGGIVGLGRPASHAEQHLQGIPAGGERGVQIHGAHERLDGRRRGAHRHVTMASLLEQAAIVRTVLL
jgi:hypothetical protein